MADTDMIRIQSELVGHVDIPINMLEHIEWPPPERIALAVNGDIIPATDEHDEFVVQKRMSMSELSNEQVERSGGKLVRGASYIYVRQRDEL